MAKCRRLPRQGAAAILFACALFAAACKGDLQERLAQRNQAEAHPPIPAGTPLRMPDFTLKDLQGNTVTSEQFRGKILLVDFWATWCAPCKQEMPGFEKLHKRFHEKGLEVIGIALDPDPQQVAKFARSLGVSYTILLGDSEVLQKWKILGIPTTFIIDRSGVILKQVVGFEYEEVFEKSLEELL
jgi:peroxiredoxin